MKMLKSDAFSEYQVSNTNNTFPTYTQTQKL